MANNIIGHTYNIATGAKVLIIECVCGEEITLFDPISTVCSSCTQTYSPVGVALASRELWEDDIWY